jgi:hypothetical protein
MKRKAGQEPPYDPVLAGIEPALKRAALRAREIAAQTGTPLVYSRNGKLVREFVSAKRPSTGR